MKWGIRKDLRKTGSVSKKTKNKIKKAITKASYRKTGRMLNQLERMKGDDKGRIEDVFKKSGYSPNKSAKERMRKLNKNLTQLNSVTKDINKIAKKKNYEYDKITNRIRYTKRARAITGASSIVSGYLIAPEYGAAGAYGVMRLADRRYRKQTGRQNSPYFVKGTDFYRRKKKKG